MIIPRLDRVCVRYLAMLSSPSSSSSSSSQSPPAALDYKVIDYPIPGNDRGGHLHLFVGSDNGNALRKRNNLSVDDGNENDNAGASSPRQLVLMMGGYPDDQSVFHPMARRLTALPEVCAVGVICMPGFDIAGRPSSSSSRGGYSIDHQPRGGFSIDDCATTVRNAASALRSVPEATELGDETTTTLTGVFHDWGVMAGLVWANRALKEKETNAPSSGPPPDRLVILDVGAGLHPATARTARRTRTYPEILSSLPAAIVRGASNWLYRILLAAAFVLQQWVSSWASALVVAMGLGLGRLGPLRDVDNSYIGDEVRAGEWEVGRLGYISYPYWNTLVDILSGRFLRTWGKHWHLPRDLDRTPVLLMTGEDKNGCFHDEDAADFLKHNGGRKSGGGGSNWISLPDAGHWLFWQQPDICFNAVRDFILSDSEQPKAL